MKRKTGQDRSITQNWRPQTQAIRGGTARSEYGETSEALFLTSGYCYDRAEDAAARFAGVQAGTLVGGSIVVETVFAWPGLGRLIFEAVIQRDYPVLLGIFLVLSILVIAFNILTDILYRLVDPRIGAVR